ncbi:2-hydroxyacyl-CoA dehydratase [Peristeroidobacter agariperforans]|uniref:2-hydroxyacyl-CoA dehydratase n=1 Tax=Peristeroidobacter agariperforans TaxID=268404 RepID=UPI00101DB2A6|nr:2-hydroxyacyl-CoA dehydratase family protein [Peristeroidobacter agariperforans]
MSLLSLLNRTLDDPLQAARSRRAIGYLGWDVPVELILAAGAAPVQLSALPHSGDTTLADRFLESSFSAQSRVVADRWLAGDLDCLDAVIFSRSDDNAQRLYYYLCELQRMGECKGPRPVLYDLARIHRGSSVAHTIESTQALASAVGVDESRLAAGIERVVARQALQNELARLRIADEVPLGSVGYRIVRGGRTDWSDEFDRSMREWLASPATVEPRKRMLLVGSVPFDDHVHAAIEVDGTVVVGEINEACSAASIPAAVTRAYQSNDDAGSLDSGIGSPSPVELIARRCYEQTRAISTLLQSPVDIVKAARALRADGVVVWMLATDTGLAWEAPRIERSLHEASLPTLMLTSQPQTLTAEALTQIAQFRRALEAR